MAKAVSASMPRLRNDQSLARGFSRGALQSVLLQRHVLERAAAAPFYFKKRPFIFKKMGKYYRS